MLVAICVFLLLISPVPAPPTDGQVRVLSESFSSPSLNTTLWNYGYPWGSYYTHRANTTPRQVRITADGLLNITATRERSINQGLWTEFGPIDLDFTSGAVNTNGKFCIKNGYVEISVRVPDIQSTWPSVFLVPDSQGQVPMLTIMEAFDARTQYSYGFKYSNDQGSVEEMSAIALNRPTSDGVHRYGLDWGYDQITWYYDDNWVNTITKSKELKQVNNMCLVIGLGVGGKSKETPVDPRAYPAIMSINLVEIWQPKYDGFFKFQNVQTGLLLEIDSASHNAGARVLQWYDNGGDWQVSVPPPSEACGESKWWYLRSLVAPLLICLVLFTVDMASSIRRSRSISFDRRAQPSGTGCWRLGHTGWYELTSMGLSQWWQSTLEDCRGSGQTWCRSAD